MVSMLAWDIYVGLPGSPQTCPAPWDKLLICASALQLKMGLTVLQVQREIVNIKSLKIVMCLDDAIIRRDEYKKRNVSYF